MISWEYSHWQLWQTVATLLWLDASFQSRIFVKAWKHWWLNAQQLLTKHYAVLYSHHTKRFSSPLLLILDQSYYSQTCNHYIVVKYPRNLLIQTFKDFFFVTLYERHLYINFFRRCRSVKTWGQIYQDHGSMKKLNFRIVYAIEHVKGSSKASAIYY